MGGVPHECSYDNMATAVLKFDAGGKGRHRFHDGMLNLRCECSFTLRLCKPYCARTKGEVKQGISYVHEDFFKPVGIGFSAIAVTACSVIRGSALTACAAGWPHRPRWSRGGVTSRRALSSSVSLRLIRLESDGLKLTATRCSRGPLSKPPPSLEPDEDFESEWRPQPDTSDSRQNRPSERCSPIPFCLGWSAKQLRILSLDDEILAPTTAADFWHQ